MVSVFDMTEAETIASLKDGHFSWIAPYIHRAHKSPLAVMPGLSRPDTWEIQPNRWRSMRNGLAKGVGLRREQVR